MGPLNILVTGATGYIGGSILSTIIQSKHEFTKNHNFSVIVRGQDKVDFFKQKGFKTYLFSSLDEEDVLEKVASEHDVVIHTASGHHTASAKALVTGLGERRKQTGRDVHYIHTSGTSNLGDQAITGKYIEDRIFSDKDEIYAYEKMRNSKQPYEQRATDLVIVETGKKFGVKTTIIMSPTIYGVGTGFFNKLSIQIPMLVRSALKYGQAEVIGEGKGIWDQVHVADLCLLYEIVLAKVLAGEPVPIGEQGIIFSETGRFSWFDASQSIANALFAAGALKTNKVRSISLEEGAEKWSRGRLLNAEVGFASTSRTKADVSRELGWKPNMTLQEFYSDFESEVALILKENSS